MKKKRTTLHNNIVLINISLIALLTVFFLLTFLTAFFWQHLTYRKWIITGICIVFAGFMAFIVRIFQRKVYLPIRHMEQTIYQVEHSKTSLEEEHQKEILYANSKFAELQSQINPHFLYNTLESIRGLAVINDNYKIADMTEALAKYFRYNISRNDDKVTLSEELDNIRNYVHIQQYRFDDRFNFAIYCHDTSKQCMNALIPKMTLQPIVENAIYHGVENKVEKGHISIHVEATKDVVMVNVADDGHGMDEDALNKLNLKLSQLELNKHDQENRDQKNHNGVAMSNINQRIKLLFGDDYGIYVSSTPGYGTEVEVRIPMVVQESGDANEN